MNSENKINKLAKCIDECNTEDYVALLEALDFKTEDFLDFINFSEEKYVRSCVAKGDGFELILLAWEKGQKSSIHGHDGNEGWVYVLQGEFEEKRYQMNSETEDLILKSKVRLHEKEICHTSKDKTEFHSIANVNDGRSLSLHLYKNPIKQCRVYDEKNDEMVKRNLSYDFKNEAIIMN